MQDSRYGYLLLFLTSGSWRESYASLCSHGPYIHAEICIDEAHMIGAHPSGIMVSPLPRDMRLCASIDLAPYTTQAHLDYAISWAIQQAGRRYTVRDRLAHLIKWISPNTSPNFAREGCWDSASFVTRYLKRASIILPTGWNDPMTMTPNDLARVFGLLAPRKSEHDAQVPLLPWMQLKKGEIHA